MVSTIRRTLDGLYKVSGVVAACFLITIVVLIVIQMASRQFGFPFRGGSDYSGYSMAAASFFGFAYALNHGAHIRVTLALTALGRFRFWGEVWCFGFSAFTACTVAWYAVHFTYESYCGVFSKSTGKCFPEISQGLDATPLWIPQLSMAIGSVILAIAFIDNFVSLLIKGRPNIAEASLDSGNDVSDDDTLAKGA